MGAREVVWILCQSWKLLEPQWLRLLFIVQGVFVRFFSRSKFCDQLWWASRLVNLEDSALEIRKNSEGAQIRGYPCRESHPHDTCIHIDPDSYSSVRLTALYFFTTDHGDWQCAGFDASKRKWRKLRSLTNYLPGYSKPDREQIKEYVICSKGGLACMDVSKTSEDQMIVFNWVTGEWKELPPLNRRRKPVLLHLVVDELTQSYQIIAVGSSRAGDECLSRVTEVYESRTGQWTMTEDLPGPGYALNEYQSGVLKDGILYCIAFLDQEGGRGILRYNLTVGVWLKNWRYPIGPLATISTILQLVENGGKIYLFSEQVDGHKVEQRVDRIDEWGDVDGNICSCSLHNVVRVEKTGGPSLEVYPESVCVPYGEHQLCMLNTMTHSGVVYDVENPSKSGEVLPAPPASLGYNGENFFTMNAMSFTIKFPQYNDVVNHRI